MTHLSQDLHNAFPDDTETLRRLKADDAHFQALSARFDALDEEARLEEIKKHRLALLDEIAALVAAERA
jgi:uncharacterized protein YdcH (DUF465 family)